MAILSDPIINLIYLGIAIIATYISAFHLLLWNENKNSIWKQTQIKNFPAVSIIIPAYNEGSTIGNTLKNLLNLNYPKNKTELIVVDDGSTDETYRNAVKFKNKNVKIFRKVNGGKASALNFGIKESKNDFVVVIDADSELDKDALRNAVQYFTDPKIAAVTSHILVKNKKTLLEKWQDLEFMAIALARKVKEKLNLIDATPGPMSVYRKDILYKIGLFDEKNLLEDVEIAWRILKNGYKIKMAYDSVVHTNYPSTLSSWWKQRTRWGIGGLQTLVKHYSCIFHNHPLGTFVIPFSLAGYILQILGVFASVYLIGNLLINNSLYYINSFLLGTQLRFNFNYLPNEFTLYGLAVLALSLAVVIITLKNYSAKPKVFSLLTFLSFYLFLFPLVSLYSLYKYLKKDFGWLTK